MRQLHPVKLPFGRDSLRPDQRPDILEMPREVARLPSVRTCRFKLCWPPRFNTRDVHKRDGSSIRIGLAFVGESALILDDQKIPDRQGWRLP